ncbi:MULTISPECIES: hypothetical protein [Comamonas]|uniref:hypothetical protein n=1 Tax=Comamonas TaxID=283 RepID=UPI00063306E7|nr:MULTISPECIES: hypothetical protein [Comamonas]MDH1503390.1 hypothetical protein [Comamonas terrigena]GAO73402.1 hypothetical protein CSE6_038_48390 [Comamonas sp. E6]
MDKKKSLVEREECKVGLKIQLSKPDQSTSAAMFAPLMSKVQSGSISLEVTRHLDDSQLRLCIAMHTYMGLLLKVAGPHFEWDDARQCAQSSALGARLLLCADILDEYLGARVPLGWNDGDVHLHSAYVTLFRATVAVAATQVRFKQGLNHVDCRRLKQEDVDLLNRGVRAALRWMTKPQSCGLNRRLYVEMKKTERSIDKFVQTLEPKLANATTVLVKMKGSEEYDSTELSATSVDHCSPLSYVEFFKNASSYITQFQKVWPEALLGKLARVTQSEEARPQCAMLFFLPQSSAPASWKTLLQAFNVDFNNKRMSKGVAPVRLDVADLTEALKRQPGYPMQAIHKLVDDLFVKELRYRRLNLPRGRRSWS